MNEKIDMDKQDSDLIKKFCIFMGRGWIELKDGEWVEDEQLKPLKNKEQKIVMKEYTYEEIKDEITEDNTLLLPDENDDLTEYSSVVEYNGDLKLDEIGSYVKVRSENGVLTEIYKTLDGINYDWYPITEEDYK